MCPHTADCCRSSRLPTRARCGGRPAADQEKGQGAEHAHQLTGKSRSGLHWCGDLFQSSDKITWVLEVRYCFRPLLQRKQSNVCKHLLLLGLF